MSRPPRPDPQAEEGDSEKHRPRKRFGQNFLTQPAIAARIVSEGQLTGTETVLEIGPGRGALTQLLAERTRQLIIVEIDRDLAAALRIQFAGNERVTVAEADILDVDLATLLPTDSPALVIANLPYNISTPVLIKLLEVPERFTRLVLMLQREVADRLAAKPGTKAYGTLSVLLQMVATVRIAFPVSPGCFYPRPSVDSAVVVIDPLRPQPYSREIVETARLIVRTVFTQRRKQLRNTLGLLVEHPEAVLERCSIAATRRPETLTAREFATLAEATKEILAPEVLRRSAHSESVSS